MKKPRVKTRNESLQPFGEILKEFRAHFGLSQLAAAESLELPIGSVRDYEQGRNFPEAHRRKGLLERVRGYYENLKDHVFYGPQDFIFFGFQDDIPVRGHGGARAGSGRKKKGARKSITIWLATEIIAAAGPHPATTLRDCLEKNFPTCRGLMGEL